MFTWTRQKIDGMTCYFSKATFNGSVYEYEIRSWPYDESGDGRFQLCIDGYHRGNYKTLTEAKQYAEY